VTWAKVSIFVTNESLENKAMKLLSYWLTRDAESAADYRLERGLLSESAHAAWQVDDRSLKAAEGAIHEARDILVFHLSQLHAYRLRCWLGDHDVQMKSDTRRSMEVMIDNLAYVEIKRQHGIVVFADLLSAHLAYNCETRLCKITRQWLRTFESSSCENIEAAREELLTLLRACIDSTMEEDRQLALESVRVATLALESRAWLAETATAVLAIGLLQILPGSQVSDHLKSLVPLSARKFIDRNRKHAPWRSMLSMFGSNTLRNVEMAHVTEHEHGRVDRKTWRGHAEKPRQFPNGEVPVIENFYHVYMSLMEAIGGIFDKFSDPNVCQSATKFSSPLQQQMARSVHFVSSFLGSEGANRRQANLRIRDVREFDENGLTNLCVRILPKVFNVVIRQMAPFLQDSTTSKMLGEEITDDDISSMIKFISDDFSNSQKKGRAIRDECESCEPLPSIREEFRFA